jgi:HPt (histidine-containing phosphotransfer) domain-containing protein
VAASREAEAAARDAADPRDALVDLALLSDAAGNDEARMRDLVGLYFRQMSEQMPLLRAAIAAGSAGEVRRIAHRCAGSSASCGMAGVVPPLRDLERMGKERELGGAARVFADLERRLELVRDRLRERAEKRSMMQAAR